MIKEEYSKDSMSSFYLNTFLDIAVSICPFSSYPDKLQFCVSTSNTSNNCNMKINFSKLRSKKGFIFKASAKIVVCCVVREHSMSVRTQDGRMMVLRQNGTSQLRLR